VVDVVVVDVLVVVIDPTTQASKWDIEPLSLTKQISVLEPLSGDSVKPNSFLGSGSAQFSWARLLATMTPLSVQLIMSLSTAAYRSYLVNPLPSNTHVALAIVLMGQ
jgi:hypothetical protein